MPAIGPIKRSELIFYLRRLGFDGPFPGGRHQFMRRGAARLVIPNPHHGDIGVQLLMKLLREAGIDRPDWENL